MKSIQIQKNRPLEMTKALFRYILHEEYQKQSKGLGYILNEETTQWVEEINQQISPFLRNDLKLIRQMRGLFFVIIKVIFSSQLQTINELLAALDQISPVQFLQYYLEGFDQTWNGEDPLDFDHFKQILKEHYSEDEIQFIVQSLQYPKELKEKLFTSLKTFYQQFYQPIEEKIIKKLDEKIHHHQELFQENPELFCKTIFLINIEELNRMKTNGQLSFFASYFDEFSVDIYNISPTEIICTYSIDLEQRYNQETMAEKQKMFFKILSDEKRVEILKLLAQRKWYGNELAKHFNLTTATMSYHLSMLVDLGLIYVTRGDQNRFYYRLKKDRLQELFLNALQDITGEELKFV